jgi:hypothetical protein
VRIAFDLDDTLVPCQFQFPLERPRLRARALVREPLRLGTVDLLRHLRRMGCALWIYTTSLRNPIAVHLQFLSYGIRLGGVVNQDRHVRRLRNGRPGANECSKYPPAFGIDLLVDNSEGVREEGRRFGFRVLHVRPDDPDWARVVRTAVFG